MQAQKKHRKLLLYLAKVIVAILVTLILIRKISLDEIIFALHTADRWLIAAGFSLVVVNLGFQFRKWQLIVHRENRDIPARSVLGSLLVGMALGLITPGRVGEFGRSFFIRGADWARLMALTFIDKMIALGIIYLFGLYGFYRFMVDTLHPYVLWPILITISIFLIILFLFLLRPNLLQSITQRIPNRLKHPVLHKLASGIELATPKLTMRLLLYTILQNLTFCTQMVLLIRAFYPAIGLEAYTAVFAVMMTKTLLPISLGDLGIRESASVYFFSRLNVPHAAAFDASLLLFMINVLLPALIGLFIFIKKRMPRE